MDPRDVPILVLGFNRPDLIEGLIEDLRELQPKTVFYAVDGPRLGVGDEPKVAKCRELVTSIDWPCTVQTRFLETNQGCGRAVSSAITWFFDHVEEGIILEDDIRPDASFFTFAASMLERYRNEPRVFAITGTNFVPQKFIKTPGPYRFSRVPVVWGWATWRRSWSEYQFSLRTWWSQRGLRHAFQTRGGSLSSLTHWSLNFALVQRHRIDTWDLQMVHSAMEAERLTVTPNVNLVENVGFGSQATHTRRVPRYLQRRESLEVSRDDFPPVRVDARADAYLMRRVYGASAHGMVMSVFRYFWGQRF